MSEEKSNINKEDKTEKRKGPGLSTIGLHVGQEEPDPATGFEGSSHIFNIIICVQRYRTCSKSIWP